MSFEAKIYYVNNLESQVPVATSGGKHYLYALFIQAIKMVYF